MNLKKINNRTLYILCVAGALFITLMIIIKPVDDKKPFGKKEALSASYEFIQPKEFSKTGFQFAGDEEILVTMVDDTTYLVNGRYDYTNEFDVKLHTNYKCYIIYHPSTDHVTGKISN